MSILVAAFKKGLWYNANDDLVTFDMTNEDTNYLFTGTSMVYLRVNAPTEPHAYYRVTFDGDTGHLINVKHYTPGMGMRDTDKIYLPETHSQIGNFKGLAIS